MLADTWSCAAALVGDGNESDGWNWKNAGLCRTYEGVEGGSVHHCALQRSRNGYGLAKVDSTIKESAGGFATVRANTRLVGNVGWTVGEHAPVELAVVEVRVRVVGADVEVALATGACIESRAEAAD